jgi:hypothetical protein
VTPPTRPRVTAVHPAGPDHQVATVEGRGAYRRWPCGPCPWVVDNTGEFPPEAFGHSTITAYDCAVSTFACHEAGADHPTTCAGFLLRGAEHNLTVRIASSSGRLDLSQVHDDGRELHDGYRAMAIANGLDPADPRLAPVR